MAEWLRSGLQSRPHRFDSGRRLSVARADLRGPRSVAVGWESTAVRSVNPAGLVYGTVTVATLLAAEGPRRETYPATAAAVGLTMVLYWLAHSYAEYTGERIRASGDFAFGAFIGSARHELSVLYGAAVPLVVLIGCWVAGAPLSTGVLAGLWASVASIVVIELAAGLRAELSAADLVKQTAFGALLGVGVLLLRVVLH